MDEIDDIDIPERDEEVLDELDEEVEELENDAATPVEEQDEYDAVADLPAAYEVRKPTKKQAKKEAHKAKRKKPTPPKAKKVRVEIHKIKAVKPKSKVKAAHKKAKVTKKKPLPVKHKKVAKVKATKTHKRGPKGPQWKNWRIPYQENSTSGKIFLKAIEKHGIKFKELTKIAKSTGANPVVSLKALRSGKCRGWFWEVHESKDRIRVTNYHIDKHYK